MKALTILLLVVSIFITSTAQAQFWNASPPDKPLVNVSGEASVHITPDKVVVALGIEMKQRDITTAFALVKDASRSLSTAMKQWGLRSEEVELDGISLDPSFDYRLVGEALSVTARQSIKVTLREPSKLEDFLTMAIRSGATTVLNVDFQSSELRKYRDQARQMAVKAAREKAALLANELALGELTPYSITEIKIWEDSWYGAWWHNRGSQMSQNATAYFREQGDGSGVPMGQIAVRASVAVSFLHAPK